MKFIYDLSIQFTRCASEYFNVYLVNFALFQDQNNFSWVLTHHERLEKTAWLPICKFNFLFKKYVSKHHTFLITIYEAKMSNKVSVYLAAYSNITAFLNDFKLLW